MGITGAGKSTFISHCTKKEVPVGHSLQSCTQQVSLYPVDYAPNRIVWLVDTPGFDDENRNDTDVLKEIAAWFTESYKHDVKLHGIIYLHRITDIRMTGSGMRNLSMFRKLCGPDALEHVVLATAMWENEKPQMANEREEMLRTKSEYWGDMIANGSTMLRHENNRQSAMRLIDHFVNKPAEVATTVLDLQKEMVDESKTLAMTGAGQSVDGGLLKQSERYERILADLQQDLADARQSNNQRMTDLLEKDRRKTQAQLAELAQQRDDLQITLEKLVKEKTEKMQQEYEARIELLKKDNEKGIRRERESHQAHIQNYQERFEEEAHLVNELLGGRSPSKEVLNWPVSMSLFGDHYWFDALFFDIG
ncbi:hypothetical protein CPLU01_12479 [Colletotrichum plurivorum]|uniref:G domain-containing protein n=1 Tax=Colletotrichum plurivorum TaxID=2175906 RepID=A0A8H6N5Z8_9PEZI|nr:hypothetical protein CPLU01_12479 [Colletotrichum plurivorum]